MELWIVLTVLLGVFFFFMLMGLPIFLAFLASNIAVLYIHSGTRFFQLVSVGMFESLNSFILVAVPLFVLMGELTFRCGFVDFISKAFECLVGRVHGHSALLTVGVGTILAVLSGAPIATSATLGTTLVPRMLSEGYEKWFACGSALGGASLATLIPPSSLAIVLATLAEVSPARVLIGGLLPGLVAAALFAIFINIVSKTWPQLAPEVESVQQLTTREKIVSLAKALSLGIIVFLVLGVIFLGIATPTEAAALGVMGVAFLAIGYRRLTYQITIDSLQSTVKITSMIFLILAGSNTFGQVLSLTGAGPQIVNFIIEAPLSSFAILCLMLFSILMLGCFMDSISMMMITIPIYTPIIIALGFDPLWFCVLILITVGIAGITPPVGMVLYALKGVSPEVTISDVYRGAVPFFALQLIVLVLTIVFPSLALWLPNLMY